MTRAIDWFVRNPVAANLLMLLLIGAGLVAMPRIPQKAFPDIDIDVVTVTVVYLGATPEEVEESVCVRIEEQPGRTSRSSSATSRTRSTRSPPFPRTPRSRSCPS
jgi:multidrug efflux pump subunit AcrB